MAIVTNTYQTFTAKGIREELSNVIYNISPEDTPFMANGGRGSVGNTLFEWQTDALAAADSANAQIEGDDVASFTAATPTVRVGNYTQISRKVFLVAGTLDSVNKAGRKSELAYQISKNSAELKRDMETIALQNIAGTAGSSGAARKTAGLLAWIKTNVTTSLGAGGSNPAWTSGVPTARTDGTQRAFTETLLKDACQKVWASGGSLKMLMLGPTNKQVASSFAGIATKTYYQSAVGPSKIIGAADVYVNDFGTLSIVPNRFQRDRDALLVDPEYYSFQFLRKFKIEELAKTGDAEKRMLIVEWGLKVNNEAAFGLVPDLS